MGGETKVRCQEVKFQNWRNILIYALDIRLIQGIDKRKIFRIILIDLQQNVHFFSLKEVWYQQDFCKSGCDFNDGKIQ